MPGFEAPGAVLGTIPLLISALEHYQHGMQALKKWRRYETVIQCLIRNINIERARLQNVCEKVLDGLVLSAQIDAMVKNPNGDLWTNEEIQEKIRARLWTSWTVFQQTLRDIQVAITYLSERVGDGSDVRRLNTSLVGNELSSSLRKGLASLLNKELKRVEFLLRQSTYEDLLSTVKDGISSLESLASMNIELEPKRRVRSRVRLLNILRSLSSSVYRAVCYSLTCACKHHISMRVSDYKTDITPDHDDEYVFQKLQLHLALSTSTPRAQFEESTFIANDTRWKELLIRSSLPPQMPVQICNSLPGTTKPITSRTKQKQVKFLPLFSSSTTATMVQTETSLANMSLEAIDVALAKPNTQPAIDLCDELKKSDYFGIISDKSHTNTRSYSVSPFTLSAGNWKMVSLKDSLESPNVQVSYKQRLQLSVLITRSVLQFYKTPWLPEIPSNRDIFFVQSESGSSFDYDRPFLMARSDQSEAKLKTIDNPTIRNPTLLAIGVLLIELLQGKPIESLQAPEEKELGNDSLSLYTTASRLLRGVYREASSNYGTAVSRCIDGKIQGKHLNLENENDLHDIYCGVVALLEEDLNNS